MTEGQSKLRRLHYLLKDALGDIPLERRRDRTGLSLPVEEYSFIESDDEPLDMWTYPHYYLDDVPKYAELTGLVAKHPDYAEMQDILQWFADNEENLRETGFTNEELAEHPELRPRKTNPTGIENPADYMSKITFEKDTDGDGDTDTKVTKVTDNDDILNFDNAKEDDDILV